MAPLRQFNEYSTWRKHDVVIDPHEVYALNFNDSMPNIFVLNNPNTATLKIGISTIPRSDSYEFKVEYNTTETFGRPFGSNKIYILNDSSVEVKINIFSIEKDFDPVLLKNMNVALEGYTLETSTIISGFDERLVLPIRLDSEVTNTIKEILNYVKESDETTLAKEVNEIRTILNTLLGSFSRLAMHIAPPSTSVLHQYSVPSFYYQASQVTRIHFDWLSMKHVNDGYIAINDKTIITIKANEMLKDFDIILNTDDRLSIGGDAGVELSFNYSFNQVG